MSDEYNGPERRRAVGEESDNAKQIGYLTAQVENLTVAVADMRSALTLFIREQKEAQAEHTAQSKASQEDLARKITELENELRDHIRRHKAAEQAAQSGPWAQLRKKFLETLFQALALLGVGGLAWLALQYLGSLQGGTP